MFALNGTQMATVAVAMHDWPLGTLQESCVPVSFRLLRVEEFVLTNGVV